MADEKQPAPTSETPMSPERLADLRAYSGQEVTGDWVNDGPCAEWILGADQRDIIAELLADRDRLAAEVAQLSSERDVARRLFCDAHSTGMAEGWPVHTTDGMAIGAWHGSERAAVMGWEYLYNGDEGGS